MKTGAIANSPVGGSHLGMYTSSGTAGFDGLAGGGGWVTRGNYGLVDTAGVLPAGTALNFRDVTGTGGIRGDVDASSWFGLPANQSLVFRGSFDYQRDDYSFGGAFSGDSASTDVYIFTGAALYTVNTTYLKGEAGYGFGHGQESQTSNGSTGSFGTQGWWTDLKAGNIFVLANTLSSGTPGIPTKAPPKPAGGYLVGLDLGGRIGYSDVRLDGFTDSTGFVFGTAEMRYGDVGARAQLFMILPANGFFWMPSITGTVDREFSFSSTQSIPAQVTLPTGDLITAQQGLTFWGGEAGLEARSPAGWIMGAKGFYTASSDLNIAGGNAYVKIPLNYAPRPVFATRY